jgi:hypothetical protein
VSAYRDIIASTPDIIAIARHDLLYESSIRQMRKKNSDGGNSGSKKYIQGYGDTYGGVWRTVRLTGVWSKAVGQESAFSRLEDVFTFKLRLNCFFFNTICKDNAAIYRITVHHKRRPFPPSLTSYLLYSGILRKKAGNVR